MDNVKQVAITGSAVNDYMGGGGRKTRRGRRSAAVAQQGGDYEDPGVLFEKKDPKISNISANTRLNIVKTGGALTPPLNPQGGTSSPLNPPTLIHPSISASSAASVNITAPSITTSVGGGFKAREQVPPEKPKVVLAPKQKTKKVILAAKHQQKLHLPQKKPHKQTIRRVCLPVNVIKTKIAKTRRHIKDSQSMSIDKIRKELISSKLLNPASKAPDALLRKIYADVKIIGTN